MLALQWSPQGCPRTPAFGVWGRVQAWSGTWGIQAGPKFNCRISTKYWILPISQILYVQVLGEVEMNKTQALNESAAFLEIKQVYPRQESKAGGSKCFLLGVWCQHLRFKSLNSPKYNSQPLNPGILTLGHGNHKMLLLRGYQPSFTPTSLFYRSENRGSESWPGSWGKLAARLVWIPSFPM